jgi:transcriptional regulator with XRE-family HTH domain
MKLNEKIAYCRKRKGLSQEDLAARIGVSRQSVSKWETGDAQPETSKLLALADSLGVHTDWLLDDSKSEEEPPAAETAPQPLPDAAPVKTGRRKRILWAAAAAVLVLAVLWLTRKQPQFDEYWISFGTNGLYRTRYQGIDYYLDQNQHQITFSETPQENITRHVFYSYQDQTIRIWDFRKPPVDDPVCRAEESLIRQNDNSILCETASELDAGSSEYQSYRKQLETLCRKTASRSCSTFDDPYAK